MPYVTPILSEAPNTDNTGEYEGYQIRVKGDGRVQAVDADGNTTMHRNVLDAKTWIDDAGPTGGGEVEPPEPEPGMEPTLTSIDPTTVALNAADITLHCHGTNFTETSKIIFAGQPEPIEFVSAEEVTTIVKPSLPWGEVTLQVAVQQGTYTTDPLDFTFTAAEPEAE